MGEGRAGPGQTVNRPLTVAGVGVGAFGMFPGRSRPLSVYFLSRFFSPTDDAGLFLGVSSCIASELSPGLRPGGLPPALFSGSRVALRPSSSPSLPSSRGRPASRPARINVSCALSWACVPSPVNLPAAPRCYDALLLGVCSGSPLFSASGKISPPL